MQQHQPQQKTSSLQQDNTGTTVRMNLLPLVVALVCISGAFGDYGGYLDCTDCEYSIGGIGYLPVYGNCVQFLQCIINKYGYIDKAILCCPNGTFWNQEIKNCDAGECYASRDGCPPVVGFNDTCRLWASPDDQTQFYQHPSPIPRMCPAGTVYRQINCTCVHGYSPKKCYNDPLLHFPFAYDFNDIQCPKAAGMSFGDAFINGAGGYMQLDGDGDYMTFAFLNNWFAQNQPDNFLLSLWFKQTDDGFNNVLNSIEGLFSNGNCDQAQTISLYLQYEIVNGGIGASGRFTSADSDAGDRTYSPPNVWCHLAIRFSAKDGEVTLFLNGVPIGKRSVSSFDGTMSDSSVGLAYLDCDPNFFSGCIDDVMVFVRDVSDVEVAHCVFGNGRTLGDSEQMYTCPY